MRVLVTGGAGFLGSHLCRRLAEEHEVICLDNFFTGRRQNVDQLEGKNHFEIIRHDVCEPIVVEVDQIYHLACPASPIHYQRNPVRTIQTCIQGTLNMLQLAREIGARIMIASTSEVYGSVQVHPQPESYWGHVNPVGPRACYDEGKRGAEALTVSYVQQYGIQARIARIFNTYGPAMLENDGRVISNFIVQCLRGQPITLYGDGKQTRSFCYVDDLIEGFIRLMSSEEPGPVNLGNPHEMTIAAIAERIRSLLECDVPLQYVQLPVDDPPQRCPDITRARELLGWEPHVDLDEGLRRTIAHFQSRASRERWAP